MQIDMEPHVLHKQIRQTEMLMVGHKSKTNTGSVYQRESAVRHVSSKPHDYTRQEFLRTTANTDKKAINEMITKQGQDKSQLY